MTRETVRVQIALALTSANHDDWDDAVYRLHLAADGATTLGLDALAADLRSCAATRTIP